MRAMVKEVDRRGELLESGLQAFAGAKYLSATAEAVIPTGLFFPLGLSNLQLFLGPCHLLRKLRQIIPLGSITGIDS